MPCGTRACGWRRAKPHDAGPSPRRDPRQCAKVRSPPTAVLRPERKDLDADQFAYLSASNGAFRPLLADGYEIRPSARPSNCSAATTIDIRNELAYIKAEVA
jgi:hypothetical protein